MIKKKIIDKGRIRRVDGGFAFIPHRFLTDGFRQRSFPRPAFALFLSDPCGRSLWAFVLQLRQDLHAFGNEPGPIRRRPVCVDQKGPDRFRRHRLSGTFAT